jgi:hypothetical protein
MVAEGASAGKHGRTVAALESVPRQVTLAHYDPAREYQTGSQQARRPGPGVGEDRVEMPAAIEAGTAKTMAAAVLARAETGRERRTVALGWDALDVLPGACVTIAGIAGVWRVSGWSLEHMVLSLECVRLAAATLPLSASPGRALPAPDVATGTTVLEAFELLPLDDTLLSAPRVTIVASGTAPGWRRAALLYSIDDGARWTALGSTAAPGVIGRLATTPGVGGTGLVDRVHGFEVELAHGEMTLESADSAALDAGANLALVGDELLQFGTAVQLSATRWRVAQLWRGQRGTEAAAGAQSVGDRFVLIAADSALSLDLPASAIGSAVRLMASGTGDSAGPIAAAVTLSGASIVPPCVVQLRWSEQGDGDVAVQWVRRSRIGWRWSDGVDAPLGEEREAYRISVLRGDGAAWTIETSTPALTLARADRASGVVVSVRQVGAHGASPPATLSIADWTG